MDNIEEKNGAFTTQEKSKCLEKLIDMEKYLPFLDFMIDKIKKKGSEIPLDGQLNKFRNLRSMIHEKGSRYNWDAIVRVEEVILKLIEKLDYKDTKHTNAWLRNTINRNTGNSVSFSSTPTISVSNASSLSYTRTVDSRPNMSAVDSSTANAKLSDDSRTDIFEKVESNLGKDLDVFALMDNPDSPKTNFEKTMLSSIPQFQEPQKDGHSNSITFHTDLLSSSREKLLKSLQKKRNTVVVTDCAPSRITADRSGEKTNEPNNTSARSSRVKSSVNENPSGFSLEEPNNEKNNLFSKQISNRIYSVGSMKEMESHSKSKLRHKLSVDICEIYRVPGKSIGGSLRSLKDTKESKKPCSIGEEELFNSNKLVEVQSPSTSDSNHRKKEYTQISNRNSIYASSENENSRAHMYYRDSIDSKSGGKFSRSPDSGRNNIQFSEENQDNKASSIKEHRKSIADESNNFLHLGIESFNEDILADLVKEDMQAHSCCPKLPLPNLRPSVLTESSQRLNSETTLQDSNEFVNDVVSLPDASHLNSKVTVQDKVTFYSVSNSGSGGGGTIKNGQVLAETGLSAGIAKPIGKIENSILNEFDFPTYAPKPIEKTTLRVPFYNKNNSLLNDPFTNVGTTYPVITESFFTSRDPRLKGYKPPVNTGALPHSSIKQRGSSITTSNFDSKLCKISHSEITQRNKQPLPENQNIRNCPIVSKVSNFAPHITKQTNHGDTGNRISYNTSMVSNNSKFQQSFQSKHSGQISQNPNVPHYTNKFPKSPSQRFSQATSYAEYKRMKQQVKFNPQHFHKKKQHMNSPNSNPTNACHSSNNRSQLPISKTMATAKPEELKSQKTATENVKATEGENMKSATNERTASMETEEGMSPLDSLYNSPIRSTGRGYGLQNFRIPKKMHSVTNKRHESVVGKQQPEKEQVNPQEQNQMVQVRDPEQQKKPKKKSKRAKKKNVTNKNNMINETEILNSSQGNVFQITGKEVQLQHEIKVTTAQQRLEETSKTGANGENSSKQIIGAYAKLNINDTDINNKSCTAVENTHYEKISTIERTAIGEETITKEKVDDSRSTSNAGEVNSPVPPPVDTIFSASNPPVENSVKEPEPEKKHKEEVTQELVEALIRKSYQSGEGKLLLAQAKLFEILVRKLNAKKLKTIQKIINSESDSGSASDSSFDDTRRRKRRKKSSGKKKRKHKRIRVPKLSSSSSSPAPSSPAPSSSSESEDNSNEDGWARKKRKKKGLKKSNENKIIKNPSDMNKLKKGDDTGNSQVDLVPKSLSGHHTGEAVNINKCISKNKYERKKGQKKLLEQIMQEEEKSKADSEGSVSKSGEPEEKEEKEEEEEEEEHVTKPKAKTRMTELDRLHDDIRNMFISSGVVTATGLRMCRMLNASGGSMNNLDIVKESAKMVEEEKLKSEQTSDNRKKVLKDGSSDSDSSGKTTSTSNRSKSSRQFDQDNCHEPGKELGMSLKGPEVLAENRKKQPYVLLHKLDMNNFGYGQKLTERCLSFSRVRGRNMALKGRKTSSVLTPLKSLSQTVSTKHVFLGRNIRSYKCPRLKKLKKRPTKKSLSDIINKLPLKMATMKHLEIYNKKNDKAPRDLKVTNGSSSKKQKCSVKKKFENNMGPSELAAARLLDYAFEKKKVMYPCKLCLHITRNITSHYKMVHPDSEVLISRLCRAEAEKAIAENQAQGISVKTKESSSFAETMKKKVKCKFSSTAGYYCRFCSCAKITGINTFFAHVSSHTGEYRFKCPDEDCMVTMPTKENLKYHILSKHSTDRFDLYGKIIELFAVPVQGGTLYGHICSKCNYVQIFREGLERHVQNYHLPEEEATILRIDMSAGPSKVPQKNSQTSKEKKPLKTIEEREPEREDMDDKLVSQHNTNHPKNQKNVVEATDPIATTQQEDLSSKIQNLGEEETRELNESKVENQDLPCKKPKLDECKMKEPLGREDDSFDPTESFEMEELLGPEEDVPESILLDSCFDVKNVLSNEEGGAFREGNSKSVGNLSVKALLENSSCETQGPIKKLKVGPLEAQVLGGLISLYECYVKGCLFSTKVFDLFEKHVKISHAKTKWNGVCEICHGKERHQVHFTSYKLIHALHHLKDHEKDYVSDNINLESLLNNAPDITRIPDEPSLGNNTLEGKSENEETVPAFPRVPLLRVRNLVGDRLSKPKESEVADKLGISDRHENVTNHDTHAMFTIENVRSLNPVDVAVDHSNLKVNVPFVQTNEVTKDSIVIPGKPVLVRPCPSRQIAIRPDSNTTLPVEINQLKVVKAASVTPVVLSSLSNVTPIRILSSISSPSTSKYGSQPVMVSAAPQILQTSNALSVIVPVSTATSTTSTMTTITTAVESTNSQDLPQQEEKTENYIANPLDTLFGGTSKCGVPPSKRPRTKGKGGNAGAANTSSDQDDTDDPKKFSVLQKIWTGMSSKSVKDAKVYQQMLTKVKLCHLFKCMAIECSFTCNNENVFTQHIGLHEAQRRMKHQKLWKNLGIDANHKLRKVLNWYLCSYCCEVLSNTNNALSRHIIVEHGHCVYQCGYCFYRAISQNYVEIHQNLAHPQILKTNSRVIYKCRPLTNAPPASEALEKQGRRQSVRPYHCDQCGKKFYIAQEFMNHLTTEHQSVTAYTCHICKNLHFKADRLIVHYKLHSYCTYQCAYCLHGTETEKEMVFHLCNFHFSQPAYMYVRALAENQSDIGLKKTLKKKKSGDSQLESLKVISYDSESTNTDCIIEADLEEENQDDVPKTADSLDISAIAAELGINTGQGGDVSPLMKELDSIRNPLTGDKDQSLSVQSLLPNAQFSSETEAPEENCSLLVASESNGEKNNKKDISVPLGQLDIVSVSRDSSTSMDNSGHKITTPTEVIGSLHTDELSSATTASKLNSVERASVICTGFHKLPPVVVLSRKTGPKNVYPPKSTNNLIKKTDSLIGEGEGPMEQTELMSDVKRYEQDASFNVNGKTDTTSCNMEVNGQPRITEVMSLSSEHQKTLPKIANVVCSGGKSNETPSSQNLQPPIIRVEDFSVDEVCLKGAKDELKTEKASGKSTQDLSEKPVGSPEVIILEGEKTDKVETVTIDSEDEKDAEPETGSSKVKEAKESLPADDNVIRKEMEKLRNQIASETDGLLFDDAEADTNHPASSDMALTVHPGEEVGEKQKTLMSPIEEAICSLNKKLEEEGEKLKKGKSFEEEKKSEETKNVPRTRSSLKDKQQRMNKGEKLERSDSEDSGSAPSGNTSSEGVKKDHRRFSEELVGTDLYICGNVKCNFASENELQLKDHLYICDLSRDSSTLVCPHCSKQNKLINTFIEHLKHHGEKRFSCGLCTFASAVESSVTRHVKQKHKYDQLKTVPKDSSKEGYFVIYPKSYKVDKVDFERNGYSPGDEDKLPMQAVYQVNVKCAKCPYFTKVRSNMVRHLKIHAKSTETEGVVVVPSTAPTNPVPCLDTKERMFDKMTNLAASSQLAQAKEKTAIEALAPEDEAKMPQFIAEQLRYKCSLADCNYITVDDCMLRHHIKALHDETSYYSCPHCPATVPLDSRQVPLEKIGYHLKHHDAKLYKCPYCLYFHYQKVVVEKHTLEKHPEKRYYVHTVREPKGECSVAEEPVPLPECSSKIWKCGICNEFQNTSRVLVLEHLGKVHSTKSKYKCRLCDMKSNHYHAFFGHYASKHPGEKVSYVRTLVQENSNGSDSSPNMDGIGDHFDTTPLWQRGAPRVRHIRGILIEEEEVKAKKSKKLTDRMSEVEIADVAANGNSYYCPLCSEKKMFQTKSPDSLRSHLYLELNYQQYACTLCGKMFIDRKDFEKHHTKAHPDREQSLKQTKEDEGIVVWVDKVIAKQKEELEKRKRRLSEEDSNDSQVSPKKKKRKCTD